MAQDGAAGRDERHGTGPAGRRAAAAAGAALAVGLLWQAPAVAAEQPVREGAVTVVGDPLVHEFDLRVPGDAVTGQWEVRGRSAAAVPFEGVLAVDGVVSPVLAEALAVHYGEVGGDGEVVAWYAAGTLADPVTYSDALARVPSVRAGAPSLIPVRVSLPDPDLVTGEPGEVHLVEATFTVSYLGDGAGPGSGPGAGPGPGAGDGGGSGTGDSAAAQPPGGPGLALTGAAPWLAAAVAAGLVALGVLARRRRRG